VAEVPEITDNQNFHRAGDPLVSICIPTYNRADMIGMAVESALNQSYRNIEVIVVDNASSDSTDDVISCYKDERLRYEKNPENLGLFGNFNRCIELARGRYIHILHSDDYIDPEFTRTCIQFLESHQNVAMTFSSIIILCKDVQKRIELSEENIIFPAPEGFNEILTRRNFINCPTVMMRREVYDNVGRYSCEYPYAADLLMWLKISKRYDIAYIHDAALYYRQGEHSESFHQLFRSPSGYLDALRIFINLIDTSEKDIQHHRHKLNIALRRHMGDCLYAGITRADGMHGYKPSVFFRFACTSWSLIQPDSLVSFLTKGIDLFLIFCLWLCASLPGIRYCLKKIVQSDKTSY